LASGLLAISRGDIRATYVPMKDGSNGDLEPDGSTRPFVAHGESFL
jgi:hypothetical protein